MTKYVLDSYAWVEYFIGADKGVKARGIIESKNQIHTSVITIAEVCGKMKKQNLDYEEAYKKMISLSLIEPLDAELAKNAGVLRTETRKNIENFGMADAIILLTARALGAKLVTGDYHLKGFKEAEFL